MGTLYIDRRGTKLDYAHKALLIREPDKQPRSVPLNLLERLVVIGNVELTSNVLTNLGASGIGVTFMPARGQNRSSFMRSESHGDSTRRLGQYELATTQPNDPVWAIKLIRLRLASQHRLLHQALIHRPEQRQPIFCALEEIDRMRSHLRHSSQSLTLEQSRGYEGSATAAFFRGYTSLFPESLGFKSRNRRPPRDPVNAILSLGYALAHGDALRATMASGLDPAIGFLHQPAWGRDSLACDLTEIARSRVEQLTWHLFANRSLRAGDFSTDSDGEGVRLRKSARCNFFACWEAHAKLHRRWQKRAANTIASHCLHLGKSLNPGNSEYD